MPDHYYMKTEVICPHCDCEQYDSHEFDSGYSYECEQCDNSFNVTIEKEEACLYCDKGEEIYEFFDFQRIMPCPLCKGEYKKYQKYYSTTRIGRAENV